jgi:dephospho-CoA kinase
LSYKADGTLNREYLALVFHDAEKLQKLNHLVHPRVAEDYLNWVHRQRSEYVIKEAALLFEAKSNRGLDQIIVVSSPESLRIKRVLQRDPHRTEEQIRAIISNQLLEAEKIKRADAVIYNDEKQLLIPQVLRLHQRFLKAE